MIPFYPQNMQQLQQQGILDLGLRMLQASGPTTSPLSAGARFGTAGLGTMNAMRQAGSQMSQDQYRQMLMMQALVKQQQAAQEQQQRQAVAQRLAQTTQGPLSPGKQAAYDIIQNSILNKQTPPKYAMQGLYPETYPASTDKYTKSDRLMYLSKKLANQTATKSEEEEYYYLINADPMERLRMQMMRNYRTGGNLNIPSSKSNEKPTTDLGQRIRDFFK